MKKVIVLLLVAVGACAAPAPAGGEVKPHKTQYGQVLRVSVDTTYGVVCYVPSTDTVAYLDSSTGLSCVYSPKVQPVINP